MPTPTFKQLWDQYPLEATKKELFDVLGGGWPALVNNPNFDNTCTIRLSMALNRVGAPVTAGEAKGDGGHKDGAGRHIATRVATAEEMVRARFGKSDWAMGHQPGTPLVLSAVPKRTGILIYRVQPGDDAATGHVDLWNRAEPCRINCYASFADDCIGIDL